MRRSSGSTAPASSPTAARLDTRAAFEAASGGKRELSRQKFEALLTASPAARRLELTARMITDFVGGVGAAAAASPRSPAARGADRLPPIEGSILSPLTRPAGRPTARSPSPEGKGAILRYSYDEYCDALERLPAFAEAVFSGVAIVGNGRSVLGQTAGPAIDKFKTIVRFNDYAISEYEEHVGCKTTLWVLSDWTCVKLLNKYPERSLPVLVAIPFKFMGKPYYHARRAELEEQLTAAQLSRITFVKADLAREIIEKYHFGDRWPSSGVITIWHILRAQPRVHLHGFDFFKQIVRRARAQFVPHLRAQCLPVPAQFSLLTSPRAPASVPSGRQDSLHGGHAPGEPQRQGGGAHLYGLRRPGARLLRRLNGAGTVDLNGRPPAGLGSGGWAGGSERGRQNGAGRSVRVLRTPRHPRRRGADRAATAKRGNRTR